jgi:4-hydroxybenzoyl-CoA reductase subunit beta
MLRLPTFGYHVPASIDEALRMKVDAGDKGMFVAGGTDLYPNMKRRHQDPTTVISLSGIGDLKKPPSDNSDALSLGPGISLTALERDEDIRSRYPVVARTAELISTPLLRNMGTLGGNLCLDTRCNYYNQTYEWRRAIDFCMKKDGSVCWVAPRSPRCWAVNSSDLAPVMVALGADYVLVGPGGERVVPAGSFYRNDGIDYLAKQPHEILTEVRLPPTGSWDATYWKLRRRGSFDFPVLGVAVWIQWDGAQVQDARVVLGGVASYPQTVADAARALVGSRLDDDAVEQAATAAFRPSKPMDNTDFGLAWRKDMTRQYVKGALEELRAHRSSSGGAEA